MDSYNRSTSIARSCTEIASSNFISSRTQFASHYTPLVPNLTSLVSSQIGAALGGYSARGGEELSARYFAGGVIGPLSVSFSLYMYESKFSVAVPGSSLKRNLWRGLRLIRDDSYLRYVLLLSTMYEVTLTVLDYFLKLASIRKVRGPILRRN